MCFKYMHVCSDKWIVCFNCLKVWKNFEFLKDFESYVYNFLARFFEVHFCDDLLKFFMKDGGTYQFYSG